MTLAALTQAGFDEAELRFDGWFAGTTRAPPETPLTPCPAHALVRALLAELGHHPWAPLAEVAGLAGRMGRFAPDRPLAPDDADPAQALTEALDVVTSAAATDASPLPFPALARLAAQLGQSATFAPREASAATLPRAGKPVVVPRPPPRTPLWAVDLQLGVLLAARGSLRPALPCPGAITAAALAPQLWPGERAVVLAEALLHCAERQARWLEQSRADCRALSARLAHLRASARAPQVWLALRGFAPLAIAQLATGFGISRRGSYAVIDTLVEAGLARRATTLGRVVVGALSPEQREPASPAVTTLPSPLLAEFDQAMAELDRLLARQTG